MKIKNALMAIAITSMMLVGIGQAQDVDDAGVVYVTVLGNLEISGIVDGIDNVKLDTSFGQVNIPMAKVDGIKMNADGKAGAVVAFRNGDMVTGNLDLDKITVKTDWGKAHINTSAIQTVSSTKNGRFFSDGSGSGGWRFNRNQSGANNRNTPVRPGR